MMTLLFTLPSLLIHDSTEGKKGEQVSPCLFHLSVQFSRSVMSDSLRPHESQHTRPPCPSPTPRVHPNSCPSSQWCHPAVSSSVVPFSSCPQSLPASESFPMSHLFTGVSASASFLPKKSQGWSPSEWTGWISLQSKGLSRVFSNTTVQKHQLFSIQLSLWSNSHLPSHNNLPHLLLSPCLFNLNAEYIMRNTGLEEAQAGIKIAGKISITSDMQMTPPLW